MNGNYDSKNSSARRSRITEIVRDVINDVGDSELNRLIDVRIQNQLKPYKATLYGFIAGITVFVAAGLVTSGALFEAIAKSIYSPPSIARDTKNFLANDQAFRKAIIRNTDFASLRIENASLDTFPAIAGAMPSEVWEHVVDGDMEKYRSLVEKPEFFQALREFHSNAMQRFLIPSIPAAALIADIEAWGQTELPVLLLMAGSGYDGQPTQNCQQTFRDNEQQAILVIPSAYSDKALSYYNCTFGWPKTFLKIKASDAEVNNVKLVGVRRNGKTNKPVLLISSLVAEKLDLPGWQEYTSKANAKFAVAYAEL